jgi:ATP-dependent helicase HepA
LLRDENGRDLGRLIDSPKLFNKVRDVESSIAKKLIGMRRRKITSIIEQNESESTELFLGTIRNAKKRLDENVGRELERLSYLRSVNASVRLEEIEMLRRQRDTSLQSLDNARTRLDAVRLIVTL